VPIAGQLVPPHAVLEPGAAYRPSVNDGGPTRAFDLRQAAQFARDLRRIAMASANDAAPAPQGTAPTVEGGTKLAEPSPFATTGASPREPGLGVEVLREAQERLGRDAELWRELTVRALAQAAKAERVAAMAALGTWLVTVAGGVFGLLTMLLGIDRSVGTTLAAVGTSLAAVGGAAVVVAVAVSIRRSQSELARSMADRASALEARIDRFALLLALRDEDPFAYRAALARIELPER
jgi:hypothetical protein